MLAKKLLYRNVKTDQVREKREILVHDCFVVKKTSLAVAISNLGWSIDLNAPLADRMQSFKVRKSGLIACRHSRYLLAAQLAQFDAPSIVVCVCVCVWQLVMGDSPEKKTIQFYSIRCTVLVGAMAPRVGASAMGYE